MLSKNDIKYVTSLQRKKYRDLHGVFVAEGPKLIQDFLDSGIKLVGLYCSSEVFNTLAVTQRISAAELKKISNLKNPNQALAIFKQFKPVHPKTTGLRIALDGIQDPGNLGTIIRLCDWFGVVQLWCSLDTADCYNSKVVQASMGSLGRVAIIYNDLSTLLKQNKSHTFGGFMDGQSVYKTELPQDAVLIMGNEGQGISKALADVIVHRISIPKAANSSMESLNVATAAAVLLSEFTRATGK